MSADDMFLRIGYEKATDNGEMISYIREGTTICFDLLAEEFEKQSYEYHTLRMSIDELRAVIYKCKELGWLG